MLKIPVIDVGRKRTSMAAYKETQRPVLFLYIITVEG